MTETRRILPPPEVPQRPVEAVKSLTGRRVVVWSMLVADGSETYERDLRATSEVFTGELENRTYVNVAPEAEWYAWLADARPGKPESCPHSRAVPTNCAWVEGT